MTIIPQNMLYAVLDDGEWHSINEFMSLSRTHVTPERACREIIRWRGENSSMTIDQKITKGRRRCIEEVLRKKVYAGLLEKRGKRTEKEYRKVPKDA